ncbi:hypothetical protein [Sinomonas mesophila]|nr:hypothetical protein [Sinomonas mesophila]
MNITLGLQAAELMILLDVVQESVRRRLLQRRSVQGPMAGWRAERA